MYLVSASVLLYPLRQLRLSRCFLNLKGMVTANREKGKAKSLVSTFFIGTHRAKLRWLHRYRSTANLPPHQPHAAGKKAFVNITRQSLRQS